MVSVLYCLIFRSKTVNFQSFSLIKEFAGNKDNDTVVYHTLNPPITARYIRFRPVKWKDHISMRVELYGCREGKVTLFWKVLVQLPSGT